MYHAGLITEAIEQFTKAVEIDPHMPLHHVFLGPAYLEAGRFQDAADAFEKASRAGLRPFWKTIVLAQEGSLEEARSISAELERLKESQYVGQVGLAFAAASWRN